MPHKYNLRNGQPPEQFDKEKFRELLGEIFPSKYMKDKLKKTEESDSEYETDESDSDYETEEEESSDSETLSEYSDESGLNVNITFTIKTDEEETEEEESDEESEYETEEEVDLEKTDEFVKKVTKITSDLEEYKDLPMYKKMAKNTKKLVEKQEIAKSRAEKKERKSNESSFHKLLSNKPMNESKYFQTLTIAEQKEMLAKITTIRELDKQQKPSRIRLLDSSIPDEYKVIALQKINQLKYGSESENGKNKAWLDGFMKIPFGVYRTLPVSIADGTEKCHEFMGHAKQRLDESTYGLNDAKMQIMQYIGQLISNPHGTGMAIAIEGPMGTGKTTLVKEGISKILQRPFAFIALGGATDSSTFDGHMITYEGSIWGQIVDILMRCECMNPVIYFDELDKVSDTPKGEEIIGILTHLTDTSQNDSFMDKYFAGIKIDLSRVLFVFSYNNREKVNPILRDRMYVIKTEGYTAPQKTVIAKRYLTPSIRQNISFREEDVVLPDASVQYIIDTYTGEEKGVRNLKRCLETIYSKLNLFRLMQPGVNLFDTELQLTVTFPFTVTIDVVKKLLKVGETKTNHMMYL